MESFMLGQNNSFAKTDVRNTWGHSRCSLISETTSKEASAVFPGLEFTPRLPIFYY
jgi:hypothetical protein